MIASFKNAGQTIQGVLLVMIGFSFFSLGDVVFKYLGPYYSVYVIAFFSSVFASIVLLLAAAYKGGIRKNLHTNHKKAHCLRGIFLLIEFLCVIYAFTHMSMAKTYALVFAAPFFTCIMSIAFLKEKSDFRQWLATLFGFTGVLIILRPGFIPLDLAALAALGTALFFAAANITARLIGREKQPPLAFGLYVQFIVVPATGLLALSDFAMPSLPHLGLLAWSGVLGGGALVLIAQGFTLAPAAIAAPFQYIQMIWGIALGYFFFGDLPDLWVMTGVLMIVVSGFWLILHQKQLQVPDPGLH